MEVNRNQIVQTIIDSIEMLQCIESLLRNFKSLPSILQILKVRSSELNEMISLETESQSIISYVYQRQMLNTLIEYTSKMSVGINASNSMDATPSISPSMPSSRKHIDESDYANTLLKDTKVIPKLQGFNDITGLNNIKKMLRTLIILPKNQPQLFLNRNMCNTILLFGPPGTGKTRLVHAIAAQINADFHSISASDILSQYVGQTEKAIKILFQELRCREEFSLLFIDEIDSFCRKRLETEQEHTRRFKTEIMCQLSEIEDAKTFFVFCATNCPWDLDPAIIRRFHKRIYVPLPNEVERLEFFHHFTNHPLFDVNDTWNWVPLIQQTEGYSCSDLSDIIQNALNIPLGELEDTKVWKRTQAGGFEPVLNQSDIANVICTDMNNLPPYSISSRKVTMNDLLNASESVSRTVLAADVQKYEQYLELK